MNAQPTDENYAIGSGRRDSVLECQRLCQTTKGCMVFSYQPSENNCWLKTSDSDKESKPDRVSGRKYCNLEGT